MASSSTCETKTSSNNNNNTVVVFTDLLGIVNHSNSLTWCKSIFAYLRLTAKDMMSLRNYCKLFSKALKPLPCWTSFPHPKYSTLNKLFDCFNEVSSSGSTNVPKVLLIDNGVIAVGVFVSKTVFSKLKRYRHSKWLENSARVKL